MKYRIEPNRLVVTVSDAERLELQELHDEDPGRFGTDDFMHGWFEKLIANSELCWLGPEVCGDLTSAPMLAILGDEGPDGPGVAYGHKVVSRWAFMSYQVTSPQEKLLETGESIWEGGDIHV